MLTDSAATSVVLVTLAEDMPVSETLELARGLGQIGLPVDRVVVNSVVPPLFSMDERRSLESLDLSRSEDAGEAVLAACRNRAIGERTQSDSMNRLARELPTLSSATSYLPLVLRDSIDLDVIRQLASRLG
jgi:anion-transporting  ArsA/GET3 family ATPase